MPTPAELLAGLSLDGGWKVTERITAGPDATGGVFSVSYIVESAHSGRAFLKALDFSKAFNFERDILQKCADRRMDRVVRAIGDGNVRTTATSGGGVVQYLIFELADRDVRLQLSLSSKVDLAWKLRSLHHIATGLMQLHSAGIAHQDLKPSNVLVFEGKTSKVSDLGRAAYQGRT